MVENKTEKFQRAAGSDADQFDGGSSVGDSSSARGVSHSRADRRSCSEGDLIFITNLVISELNIKLSSRNKKIKIFRMLNERLGRILTPD